MCILIIDIFILNYSAKFFKHLISFYMMESVPLCHHLVQNQFGMAPSNYT